MTRGSHNLDLSPVPDHSQALSLDLNKDLNLVLNQALSLVLNLNLIEKDLPLLPVLQVHPALSPIKTVLPALSQDLSLIDRVLPDHLDQTGLAHQAQRDQDLLLRALSLKAAKPPATRTLRVTMADNLDLHDQLQLCVLSTMPMLSQSASSQMTRRMMTRKMIRMRLKL